MTYGNFRSGRHQGIAALMAITGLLSVSSAALAQTVYAPVGQIIGTQSDGLVFYQGIPYAAPPVGSLRWAAPQPVAPFEEPFIADKPGNECVQKAIFWRPGKAASWNEDCLSLTVYVPSSGGKNMPVMVGFHGGGSVNGAKTDWDPRELAKDGNIVVTINYRLGATGFLALPELNKESKDGKSSGNYGDLDKIQALRWVHDNISAFGGNPERVTIAGQSAGARGVCFAVASPEAKGLFQGAIIESGRDCPSISNEEAVKSGEAFVEAIGCARTSDRLSCLRAKSPAEILDAQTKSKMTISTVYGGYAQPLQTLKALETGEFNRVPMIIGNTRDETRVFVYEANDLLDQPVNRAQYESEVRSRMGDKAEAAFKIYGDGVDTNPGLALGQLDAEQKYICPTSLAIVAAAKWTPVHAYEFADVSAPIRSYANVPPSFDLGVPHSAELPYIWGEDTVVGGLTSPQRKLAALMRAYWSSLTAPDGPSGLSDWPAFTGQDPRRIVFEAGGMIKVIAESDYRASRHCDLFSNKTN
ncbi:MULTISPECIES: carboxylesterase/lipase family protein [unclassified Sinorhizobium]|uniref:carboxylesterase/lipase family protein n=1 Tax=unclassified Sinorhizobium TaxID=2613772 RepID=UPI0035234EA0